MPANHTVSTIVLVLRNVSNFFRIRVKVLALGISKGIILSVFRCLYFPCLFKNGFIDQAEILWEALRSWSGVSGWIQRFG